MKLDLEDKRISDMFLWSDRFIDGYTKMSTITEDGTTVSITVNKDADELIFKSENSENYDSHLSENPENKIKSKLLAMTIGKTIGYYWIAENNKGFVDLFALVIEDVIPNTIISCAASRLVIKFVSD